MDRVWWVTKVSKSNSGWFWILKIQAALDIVVNHAQAGEVHQCLCCCSYRWRLRAKVEEFGQLGEPADVVASCGPLRPRGGQKLGRWRDRRETVWRNCCKEWGDTKWYKVEIMSLVVAKDAKRTRVNGRLGAFWRVTYQQETHEDDNSEDMLPKLQWPWWWCWWCWQRQYGMAMLQGRIEPRQNCFQTSQGGREEG